MRRGSKKHYWTQSRGTKSISFVKTDKKWMEHDRCVLHALYISLHLVNCGNVQIIWCIDSARSQSWGWVFWWKYVSGISFLSFVDTYHKRIRFSDKKNDWKNGIFFLHITIFVPVRAIARNLLCIQLLCWSPGQPPYRSKVKVW